MLFLLPEKGRGNGKEQRMRYKLDEKKWHDLQLSVRTITKKQVGSRNQEEFVIPNPYFFIGDKAFENMTKLRQVRFSKTCRIIGREAFKNCGIEGELLLPESVTAIREAAFARSCALQSVRIPREIRLLESAAFKECRKLQTVFVDPDALLPELGSCVFDCCTQLREIVLPTNLERIERRAFYRCKSLTQIHIPKSVKKIGQEAFYYTALEELHLPERLVELEEAAFFKCTMLKSVKIPESVKRIGKWVFHGCNRLQVLEILHEPDEIGEWIINRSTKIRCRRGGRVEAYCREFGFDIEFADKS